MAVITVDCGGTNLRAGRRERAGEPGPLVVRDTPPSAEAIVAAILEMIEGLPPADAVGVAIAGLVDHVRGSLLWMPHHPGSADIADVVAEHAGIRTLVDNDANLTALAEATGGAGAGHRMVLAVTVGTGIGGGLVIDGAIEHGRGHLGEIGHMSVESGGPRCECGVVGCWEEIASGRAIDRAAVGFGLPDGAALVAAAEAGDATATGLVAEVGAAFGRGLANLVAVLDPDLIVVGGGVGAAGDVFLDPARRALAESTSGARHRVPTPVVPAAFGTSAGIVGAALMAGAPL